MTKIPFVSRVARYIQQDFDVVFSKYDQLAVTHEWHNLVRDANNNVAIWRKFILARGPQRFQEEFRVVRHAMQPSVAYLAIEALRELGYFATYRGYMAPNPQRKGVVVHGKRPSNQAQDPDAQSQRAFRERDRRAG